MKVPIRPEGDVRAKGNCSVNLRKLTSPFASGLIAFGAFAATATVASSVPVGCVTGILVSLALGYRNRSGISPFMGGAICGLVLWAALGMVLGGQAAVTSAIILVPLVAAIAGVLTIAFAAGCFFPMISWRK